ncbi:lipase member H-B [Nilaparvata lugens]|uniref:lipase member H-B n=1 Tax=Nilaparvata lugens TaxID=108931 RepID=UPI00193E3BBA|nr:lipase member H-B [Nilaparvata lugens]
MPWPVSFGNPLSLVLILLFVQGSIGLFLNALDINYWRCKIKRGRTCPDADVNIYFYNRNVSYLNRGDYNVFTIDWEPLTFFPCYLSALSNTRLVAQCAAQFYSHLTHMGARADHTHCVGHSLGAHVCGMISNHLTTKMYKIIGLDPARPLVHRYGNDAFKLTRDDAHIVQVIHTNAGLLGETAQVGHVDFCVNGGRMQPSCTREGRRIRQARCSHFMSACFFAATVSNRGKRFVGVPCTSSCRPLLPFGYAKTVSMGEHTPDDARGTFCLRMADNKQCPFD